MRQMDNPGGRCLVITGMHRSYTSVTAQILQDAGLNLGGDLIGPGPGNPGGHFEDRAIVKFHVMLLERYGMAKAPLILTAKRPGSKFLSPEIKNEALKLLDRQFGRLDQFGFKDPRTALFLPLWKEVLPAARYLFLIRHPLDCAASLMRRQKESQDGRSNPITMWKYLNLWYMSNIHLLHFHDQFPDRSHIMHVPGDLSDQSAIQSLQQRLRDWNFDLSPLRPDHFFKPPENNRRRHGLARRWLFEMHPAKKLYELLK